MVMTLAVYRALKAYDRDSDQAQALQNFKKALIDEMRTLGRAYPRADTAGSSSGGSLAIIRPLTAASRAAVPCACLLIDVTEAIMPSPWKRP